MTKSTKTAAVHLRMDERLAVFLAGIAARYKMSVSEVARLILENSDIDSVRAIIANAKAEK